MNTQYNLRFKKSCGKSCDFCPDLGKKSEQDLSLLDSPRLQQKILNYDSFQVPCNFDFSSSEDEEFIESLCQPGLSTDLLVHIDNLDFLSQKILQRYSRVAILTDSLEKLMASPILVRPEFNAVHLVVTKKNSSEILKLWLDVKGQVRKKVQFVFPQGTKKHVKNI